MSGWVVMYVRKVCIEPCNAIVACNLACNSVHFSTSVMWRHCSGGLAFLRFSTGNQISICTLKIPLCYYIETSICQLMNKEASHLTDIEWRRGISHIFGKWKAALCCVCSHPVNLLLKEYGCAKSFSSFHMASSKNLIKLFWSCITWENNHQKK